MPARCLAQERPGRVVTDGSRVAGPPGPDRRAFGQRLALLAASLAVGLGGCATPPPVPEPQALSGRLSVQVAASARAMAAHFSGGFELRGDAKAGSFDLLSPVGTLVARATWRPGEVQLQAEGRTTRHPSLSELARYALGESVPLEALGDWLRGRPWPQAPHLPLAGRFEQGGWEVDTRRAGEGFISARRLNPAPEVTLRARVDRAAAPVPLAR